MEQMIFFSLGSALPAVLISFGLSYLALKSKMNKKGFFRGLMSFLVSLILVTILNIYLTSYKQQKLSVSEEEYLNLAALFIPLFLTLFIVWIIHVLPKSSNS